MQRIDAHQHFWKFDPIRDSWITQDMSVIRRDFYPEDLQPVLQQNGLDGCIAVQADQSEDETHFLLSLSNKADFIKGVVGWVDLQAENVTERLAYFKQFPVLKGFRHILQGATDRALMLKPAFKKGIAALQQFDYTYDILIFPDQLVYAKELVAAFPGQRFIVDHLAKPYIKSKQIDEWKKDITAVAQFENVYCKVSGMVTEANWKEWRKDDFTPYLDAVVAAFGTGRIVYGSDWPVCLVAASYRETFEIVKDYFSAFSRQEQEQFFGGNAIEFYNI